MALFQPFKEYRRAATPQFMQAEIADARARQAAQTQENAARSQNMLGGASVYNRGMEAAGKSPISDFIGGYFDKAGYDPSAMQGIENMPDMATELYPEVMDPATGGMAGSPAPVTGAETSAIPVTESLAEPSMSSMLADPTVATGAEGAIPVTESIAAPAAETAATAGAETIGADLAATAGADAAAAAGTEAATTAALESALAANTAAGTAGTAASTAAGAGAGAAAGGGALNAALAALGPMGAIAALAALFG